MGEEEKPASALEKLPVEAPSMSDEEADGEIEAYTQEFVRARSRHHSSIRHPGFVQRHMIPGMENIKKRRSTLESANEAEKAAEAHERMERRKRLFDDDCSDELMILSKMQKWTLKAVENVEKRKVANAIEKYDLKMEVERLSDVEFWRQGDEEMYTKEAIAKRLILRNNVEIRKAIAGMWGRLDINQDYCVTKREYMYFNMMIYEILMDDANDHFVMEEARESAEADWEADSQGKTLINYNQFETSMFELVDTWTEDTNPDSYLTFLEDLSSQVAELDRLRRGTGERGTRGAHHTKHCICMACLSFKKHEKGCKCEECKAIRKSWKARKKNKELHEAALKGDADDIPPAIENGLLTPRPNLELASKLGVKVVNSDGTKRSTQFIINDMIAILEKKGLPN